MTQGNEIDGKTMYSIGPIVKTCSDWLLKVLESGNLEAMFPAAADKYASLIEELWMDSAVQATYNRRNELQMLPRAANYFLDRAIEISRSDYEPSDMDILYAEGITTSNSLASMEFSFPVAACDDSMNHIYDHDPSLRYQLIRVHPKNLGENCKWLEMFEDTGVVLFCVSLTDYNDFITDGNGVSINKMLASKKLFESIISHPTFSPKNFLLILNRFDLLEEIIEQVPLTRCDWFSDFSPVISQHPNNSRSVYVSPSLAQWAFHHVAAKFKRLFHSLTGRKLYVSLVTGLEADTVDEALKYAREILKWEEEKPNYTASEWFSDTNEISSYS